MPDKYWLKEDTARRLIKLLNERQAANSRAANGQHSAARWVLVRCDSATPIAANELGQQLFPATIIQTAADIIYPLGIALDPTYMLGAEVLLTILGNGLEFVVPVATKTYAGVMTGDVEQDASGSLLGRPRVVGFTIPEEFSGIGTGEVDGTPAYTGVTSLEFDQADGFVVTNPSVGVARIDIADASATQAGKVSTTSQTFAGDKTFNDDVRAGNFLSAGQVILSSFPGDTATLDTYSLYLERSLVGSASLQPTGSFSGFGTLQTPAVVLRNFDSTTGDPEGFAALVSGSLVPALSALSIFVSGTDEFGAYDGEIILFGSHYSIDIPGDNYYSGGTAVTGGLTFKGGLYVSGTASSGGTVTTVSIVTANGVSGSVANPTTTPAITLTLGAITPSSVAAAGAISGTTGTFSGAVSGTTGTFSGAISGTTGSFSGAVTATAFNGLGDGGTW